MPLSHILSRVMSPTKDPVILDGRFEFNGASNITTSQITAVFIDTIVHTGTGIWTVTLKSAFRVQAMKAIQLTLEVASAADAHVQAQPYNVSAGTFVINVHTGGALADLATTNFCSIALHTKTSNAPDGSGV